MALKDETLFRDELMPVVPVQRSIDEAVRVAYDKASIDSFGRLRVSNPVTLFDSKQLHDKQPIFWDEVITAGDGTPTSTHSTENAATTMTVDDDGDDITRQTFMRFNYQPGKSQLIFMTGVLGEGIENVVRRIGAFDANDGLFFQLSGDVLSVVKRKAGADTVVAQSSWNVDKLDGSDVSKIVINPAKAQIFVIDYEWLGVGVVRMGFVLDGHVHYCHHFMHANKATSVYMSTPNLPLRYQITSTGGAGSLVHICSSVASEGGEESTGILRSFTTGATEVQATAGDTLYAAFGIRLKSTHIDKIIELSSLSLLATTNDDFEWGLYMNPTVTGTFTFSDNGDTAVQAAQATTSPAATLSGGTRMQGGYGLGNAHIDALLPNAIYPGAAIDGTPDQLVVGIRPITNGLDLLGSITWREFS